jgi:large subunit ribosomal protein L18
MILSMKLRLVVRFSLKCVYVQLVEAAKEGDKTLTSASSKELEKRGWKASLKNTSAAYLTGLLIGERARTLGIETAILDLGLKRPSTGAKAFAVLKGANDAGLRVPYNDRVLPSEERIRGLHIVGYAKERLEEETQQYSGLFSHYLINNLKPEQLDEHFEDIKRTILHATEVEK